jgi:hypothetical protein
MAGGQFPAQLTHPMNITIDGVTYNTTNAGRTLTLPVTIPANVSSGWWGVVEIVSGHRDAAACGNAACHDPRECCIPVSQPTSAPFP